MEHQGKKLKYFQWVAHPSGCRRVFENYIEIKAELNEIETRFAESLNCEQFEVQLNELELRADSLFHDLAKMKDKRMAQEIGVTLKEFLEIKDKLTQDWNVSINVSKNVFGLLPHAESHYFSETNQKDYPTPDIKEFFQRMGARHYKSYLKMKKFGMMPELQVTPIGYKIEALLDKFRDKEEELLDQKGQFLFENVRKLDGTFEEKDLRYGINGMEIGRVSPLLARPINFGGTMTKKQWVEKNKGFLVEIVATKPWIAPNVNMPPAGSNVLPEGTLFIKDSLEFFQKENWSAKSVESHLVTLMHLAQKGDKNHIDRLALLPFTNYPNPEYVMTCHYTASRDLMISGYSTQSGRNTMWLPPVVQIDMAD